MTRTVTFILLGILLAAPQAFPREITLEECLKRALDENSGLKASMEESKAAHEESAIAFKNFLPSLRLLGNYTIVDKSPRLVINRDAFGAGMPGADTELTLGEKNFYSLTLNLQQPLFTGGKLIGTYRKANAQEHERSLLRDRSTRELIYEVKKAFYSSLAEQRTREAMAQFLQAKKERLRVLKELHREGYSSKDDVLQQEADVMFTELELLKSSNRGTSFQNRLVNLAHLDNTSDLRLIADPENSTLTVPLEDLRSATLAHREDLLASQKRIAMASADISIARGGFFPQASLTGSFQQQKETGVTHPQVWSLTATLDWSLFEWGKTVNDVRRANAKRQKEVFNHDELTRLATQETEETWRSVKELELAVSAHEKKAAAQEYRLGIHSRKYAEGQIKLADLLATEADFTKANSDYFAAVAQLATERAKLEYVSATDLSTWSVPLPLYRPAIDVTHRIMKPAPKNAIQQSLPATPNPVVSQTKQQVPPNTPANATNSSPPAMDTKGVYSIQVGAYSGPDGARNVAKSLSPKTGKRNVQIVKVGKFNKVRISGFPSKEEAEDFARILGLNDYLIIRTANGL